MSERRFFDTNIFVYAVDLDSPKQPQAENLVSEGFQTGLAVLSTQILQEFFVVATRKLKIDLAVARRHVELLSALETITVRTDMIVAAIDLQRLQKLSFWDALVVKSASFAGCKKLLSEDLQHGAVIDGVRIENPFR